MKQGNTEMQKLLMSTRNNLMIQINALDKAIDREKSKLELEWKKPSRIFLPGYDEEFNDKLYKLNVLRSLHETYGEGYEFIVLDERNFYPSYCHINNEFKLCWEDQWQDPCKYYYSEPVPEVTEHLNRLRKEGII